ncbi:MAG: hypothetical protein FJ299_12135 [Planctomycetes bacterium]|nr:hypothetical protein [Planctomycetota bacterium]
MITDPDRSRALLEVAFAAAVSRLLEQAELQAEFERSSAVFRPAGPALADDPGASLARRRHLEWFLLERPSETLGSVPIEQWAAELAAEHEGAEALLRSKAAVFEVLSSGADMALRVRDLLARTEDVLDEPEVALELKPGDLIVGRLFPTIDGAAVLSPAAIWLRDAQLTAALRRDLDALRAARRGTLRISQAELERMFFGPLAAASAAASRTPGVVRRAARNQLAALLARAGFDSEAIEAWCEHFAATPYETSGLLPGAADPLGELMEELAMHTDIDLVEARATGLQAWSVLGAATPIAPEAAVASPETSEADGGDSPQRWDAAAALAAFDRERAEGADLESAFRRLEARLGVDTEDGEEEAGSAEAGPGVLEVLIDEYAWEREQNGQALGTDEFRWLRAFAQVQAGLPGLEDLGAQALVAFATVHARRAGLLAAPSQVAACCRCLEEFAAWCEREQDHPLHASAASALEQARPDLERVLSIELSSGNACCDSPARQVRALHAPNVLELENERVQLADPLPQALRAGDWVQCASERDGRLRLAAVYPPQAADALPGRSAG